VIWTASSFDVPDEQSARLVVLRPMDGYKTGVADCPAMIAAADILNNRGNSPCIYRNSHNEIPLSGDGNIITRAAKKMRHDEAVIPQWAPEGYVFAGKIWDKAVATPLRRPARIRKKFSTAGEYPKGGIILRFPPQKINRPCPSPGA